MIEKVDDLLEELLKSGLDITYGAVTVATDPPTRRWALGIDAPTLNLYLHDLRENNKLRGQQPAWTMETNGYEATIQRRPLIFDLHYMVTAWAKVPRQEHQLLMEALLVLLRCENPFANAPTNSGAIDWVTDPPPSRLELLRRTHLPGAVDGIALKVAQYDMHINPRDIWSVLDNEMRPAIDLMVTLSVQPFEPMPRTLVREVETRYQRWAAKERKQESDGS